MDGVLISAKGIIDNISDFICIITFETHLIRLSMVMNIRCASIEIVINRVLLV